MKKQLVLVTISGPDHPGITHNLMNIISKNNCQLEDMGQSVTHGLLSLSILLNLNLEDSESSPVLKDLLFEAKKMNMQLDFEVIEKKSVESFNHARSIILCTTQTEISSLFVCELSLALASRNINILRIDRFPKTEGFKNIELVTSHIDESLKKEMIKTFIDLSDKHRVDVALLSDDVYSKNRRLLIFDMDSTLIQMEVIDELARAHNCLDKVGAITEKAMNGEINFDQSLAERVALLEGLDAKVIDDICNNLPLTNGLKSLVEGAKQVGYKLAIISGGFLPFANRIKEDLGFDYAFANNLEIHNGKLTGKTIPPVVNSDYKAFLLNFIAQQEGINARQIVAIGDGANDLPMLEAAGMGIAFHAKEIVKKSAQQRISHGNMSSIRFFLGLGN